MSHQSPHISIYVLWNYARKPSPATFEVWSDWNHLAICPECTTALWLCNTEPSVEDVQRKLSELGISLE